MTFSETKLMVYETGCGIFGKRQMLFETGYRVSGRGIRRHGVLGN
jgi:hypothetical protein